MRMKRYWPYSMVVCCWMVVSGFVNVCVGQPAYPYKFDFQPAGAPLMPGFTMVSPESDYSKEKGFGFLGKGRISAQDLKIPDDLARDRVRTSRPFRVDLPNGEYEVRVYSSDFITPPSSTWGITANGKEAFRENIAHENYYVKYYYRFMMDDAKPGQSMWEKYVAPMTSPKAFRVTVTNGSLEVVVKDHPLNGLVIVPVGQGTGLEKEAAAVEAARRAQFEKGFYHEAPYDEKAPPPPVTKEDNERGFIVFAKPYLERVYPSTNPRRWNIKNELRSFASLGEYEPVAFSIYPLRDLKNVTVQVGEIVSADGGKIPPQNCDLRMVKYMEERAGTHLMNEYTVAPQLLVRKDSIDVQKGIDRTWWLTVKVPVDAKPGIYSAKIKILVEGKESAALDYKLRVLPITLTYPPNRKHLTGAYPPRMYLIFPEQKDKKEYYAHVEAELRDILNHGFEEYSYYATWISMPALKIEDGKVVDADFSEAKETVKIYQRVGMPAPPISFRFSAFSGLKGGATKTTGQGYYARSEQIFSPEFRASVTQALVLLRDKARAEGLPPIEITLPDEPHGDRLPEALEMAKIVRSVPGVLCSSSGMVEDDCEKLGPYLHRWGTYRTPRSVCALGRKYNALVMRDHGSALRNPGATRFENGFYFWKADVPAIRWWYSIERGEPYSIVDGEPDWEGSFIYTTPEGPPNPTLDWEAAREGVDDVKYIHTLNTLIEKARGSHDRAVKALAQDAATMLDGILKPINDDFGYYWSEGGFWSPDVYDKYRWRIAEAIMLLQDALAGKKVGRLPAGPAVPAALWCDKAFGWRLPINVNPGPYEREDCVVRAAVAPTQLGQLVEYNEMAGKAFAVPVVFSSSPVSLSWMLAGYTPSEESRHFFLYYPVKAGSPAPPPPPEGMLSAVRRLTTDPNMVPNPGFEEADPTDAKRPAAWSASVKSGTKAMAVRETSGGHSEVGPCCMKLTFEKASDVQVVSSSIPLKPKTEYIYSVWNQVLAGSGYENVWSGVDFYTAENKTAGPRLRVSRHDTESGWHCSRRRFKTPPGTAYGKVTIGAGVFSGTLLFDDVSLEEYWPDRLIPPSVTLGKAERRP